MIQYVTTKDTAKLVRAALSSAFPGVKFSIRMGTGTAASWMNVSWNDGPTNDEVNSITRKYEGRSFNGVADGYEENDTMLVAFDGGEMPRELQYECDGINSHRKFTAAANRVAQHLISTNSDQKDLVLFTVEGDPISGAVLPDEIIVAGQSHKYFHSPKNLTQAMLRRVNLCTTDVPGAESSDLR